MSRITNITCSALAMPALLVALAGQAPNSSSPQGAPNAAQQSTTNAAAGQAAPNSTATQTTPCEFDQGAEFASTL
jgi:hypothetical protein